jgi:TctA family transporter
MGMFGISEVISGINQSREGEVREDITWKSMTPTRKDVKDSILPMLRGTGIGSFFGALPGTGASIAAFMSYAVEKKVAKDPSRFGNGAIEGITAPEAANNAASQTAFVPTLSLGIPGDAVMALMLSLNRELGTTLVLVTHDREIAAQCERTLTIEAGRLV